MSNFVTRTIFGALYALVVVGGLLGPQPLFLLVFGFALVWTMHEFFQMSLGSEYKLHRILWIIGASIAFITMYFGRLYILPKFVDFLWFIPVFIATCIPGPNNECAKATIFVALPLILSPVLTIRDGVYDGRLLLCLFIIVALSDVGAYILGTLLGQRKSAWKLAPKISPKKSWWGFVGALIAGSLSAFALNSLGLLNFDNIEGALQCAENSQNATETIGAGAIHSLILGALLSGIGVVGDLIESYWKRKYGVKDSGKLIPGHGGLYDRIDSILLAIPVAVIYLTLFV